MQLLDQNIPKAAALSPSAGTHVAFLRELFFFACLIHLVREDQMNHGKGKIILKL